MENSSGKYGFLGKGQGRWPTASESQEGRVGPQHWAPMSIVTMWAVSEPVIVRGWGPTLRMEIPSPLKTKQPGLKCSHPAGREATELYLCES